MFLNPRSGGFAGGAAKQTDPDRKGSIVRLRAAILGALMAAIGLAPMHTSAAEPIDWILASMRVAAPAPFTPGPTGPGGPPEGGGSFGGGGEATSLIVSGEGHGTGTGPVLIGAGFGGMGPAFVPVTDFGNGGIRLRTTGDLGEADIEITPIGEDAFAFSIGSFSIGGSPGGSQAVLVFAANAVIDSYDVKGTGGVGAPTLKTGSGSTAIYVAGPGTTGVAVDAAAASAGASSFATTTTSGIVGGAVLDGCMRCTIEWTTPEGEQGSMELANLLPHGLRPPVPVPIPIPVGSGSGDFSFAGPAGKWSWSWTGAGARVDPSTAVVGAFAPIGADWALFRGLAPVPIPTPPPKPAPTVLGGKRSGGSLAGTGVEPVWWGSVLIGLASLSFRRLRAAS
jgi:hypothetical protein